MYLSTGTDEDYDPRETTFPDPRKDCEDCYEESLLGDLESEENVVIRRSFLEKISCPVFKHSHRRSVIINSRQECGELMISHRMGRR